MAGADAIYYVSWGLTILFLLITVFYVSNTYGSSSPAGGLTIFTFVLLCVSLGVTAVSGVTAYKMPFGGSEFGRKVGGKLAKLGNVILGAFERNMGSGDEPGEKSEPAAPTGNDGPAASTAPANGAFEML